MCRPATHVSSPLWALGNGMSSDLHMSTEMPVALSYSDGQPPIQWNVGWKG
jgi:hypothetical protein